jgi:hypothetical protein
MFKSLLYLAILTAAVVLSWIGFSVHHAFTTSTITGDEAIIITPIPPSFDREVIEKIKLKKTIGADLSEQQIVQISEGEATESAHILQP